MVYALAARQITFLLDHDAVSNGSGGAHCRGHFLSRTRLGLGLALERLSDPQHHCSALAFIRGLARAPICFHQRFARDRRFHCSHEGSIQRVASLPASVPPVDSTASGRLRLQRHFQSGIQQIWIPEQHVTDRCATCHVALQENSLADQREQPFRPHPPMPHALNEFGCVICHNGQGAATTVDGSSLQHQGLGAAYPSGQGIWKLPADNVTWRSSKARRN